MTTNFEEAGIITEPDLSTSLTAREISLRKKFVEEYLTDYDGYQAAIRLGYNNIQAKVFSVRFLQEPFVLQQIRLAESSSGEAEMDELEIAKKRVIAGLNKEANYRGPGCSQAARVAALAKLAAIYGMDAPTKSKQEITGPDGMPLGQGVFVVPGIMTAEAWEAQAKAQQTKLTAPAAPNAPINPNA